MLFTGFVRRRIAWLTLWALVLNAWTPTLSQAAVSAMGSTEIEVCSSTGMIRIKVPRQEAIDGGQSTPAYDLGQHCPQCTLHGGSAGLPPEATVFIASPCRFEMPRAFYQARHKPSIWLPAHARAPPALS